MNTAAWSPLGAGVVNSNGQVGPGSTGTNNILQMYGNQTELYPAQAGKPDLYPYRNILSLY